MSINAQLMSYYIQQLDNNDPALHLPIKSVTYGRDITLKPGVDLSYLSTSFLRSTYAFSGTSNVQGLPYVARNSNELKDVSLDSEFVQNKIDLLGAQISFTEPELLASQRLGQPLDVQKMEAIKTEYEMSTDQVVYIGDSAAGKTGLVNSSYVTPMNAPNGTSGSPYWKNKTPSEISADVNALLKQVWLQMGYSNDLPNKIGLDPETFSYINSVNFSLAADKSILEWIKVNNLYTSTTGLPLEIVPMKWIVNEGTSSKQRMIAYNDDARFLRFVLAPIRPVQPYVRAITYYRPYIWGHGVVEVISPQSIGYMDGINDTQSLSIYKPS